MAKYILLTQDLSTLVDDEDYAWLNQWKWYARKSDTKTYAARSKTGFAAIKMHRAITQAPAGMVVDHINGDSLDNRRCNLRICTSRENTIASVRSRGKTLPIGVAKKRTKWQVNVFAGLFDTVEEAEAEYIRIQKFLGRM